MTLSMNLMRTLGGNNSKFCESPLSPSESVSMVISCMLNVSLRSSFFMVFVLVGKNGDENSSSSLSLTTKKNNYQKLFLFLDEIRFEWIPMIGFIFNKW